MMMLFSGLTSIMGLFIFTRLMSWGLVQGMNFLLVLLGVGWMPFKGLVSGLGAGYGLDGLSYSLVMLSLWMLPLMMGASYWVNFKLGYKELFTLNLYVLTVLLVLTFSVVDLLGFYVYFEGSLLPTLFLIMGWGAQPERVQAGVYLLFYTLLASLPLLVILMFTQSNMLNLSSIWLSLNLMSGGLKEVTWFIYLPLLFAFLVKMPMFLCHLWLPKAHVEAPVAGSMILAGVLLKLGGYGLMRVIKLVYFFHIKMSYIWVGISLMGGVMISLMCLRQSDLKALVAYSSVAHMGLVIGGIMTLGWWGSGGALCLMIGHGLCSSALFVLVNLVYERSGSRSLLINKGLMGLFPNMTFWWFMFSSFNMAAPPSLNLLGEILLIGGLMGWSSMSFVCLSLISFYSAAYTLYLYSFSQHGKSYVGNYSIMGGYVREYLVLLLHLVPLNLLVMSSYLVVNWV